MAEIPRWLPRVVFGPRPPQKCPKKDTFWIKTAVCSGPGYIPARVQDFLKRTLKSQWPFPKKF